MYLPPQATVIYRLLGIMGVTQFDVLFMLGFFRLAFYYHMYIHIYLYYAIIIFYDTFPQLVTVGGYSISSWGGSCSGLLLYWATSTCWK